MFFLLTLNPIDFFFSFFSGVSEGFNVSEIWQAFKEVFAAIDTLNGHLGVDFLFVLLNN